MFGICFTFIFEIKQQLMESTQNTTPAFTKSGNKKSSLTPRELIRYHSENPGEPITDEDIQNLNLQYQPFVGVEEAMALARPE